MRGRGIPLKVERPSSPLLPYNPFPIYQSPETARRAARRRLGISCQHDEQPSDVLVDVTSQLCTVEGAVGEPVHLYDALGTQYGLAFYVAQSEQIL